MKVHYWNVICLNCGKRTELEGMYFEYECPKCGECENYSITGQGVAYE